MRQIALGLLLMAVGGACALAAPSELVAADPTVDCGMPSRGRSVAMTCEGAVAVALQRAAEFGPVSAASMRYGMPCPPNASCVAAGHSGHVILEFVDGRCGYVTLTMGEDDIIPSAVAEWPPEAWGIDPAGECL